MAQRMSIADARKNLEAVEKNLKEATGGTPEVKAYRLYMEAQRDRLVAAIEEFDAMMVRGTAQ